jgi:hypothetical protein
LKIFLFLMLVATGPGAHAAEVLDARTGKVSEKSYDSLEFDEGTTIGFVTTTAARAHLASSAYHPRVLENVYAKCAQ